MLNSDEENEIHNWDYRLFEGEDGFLTIGEVYYTRNGKPMAFTENSVCPGGHSVEEVMHDLRAMLDAASKPVFDRKSIQSEWASNGDQEKETKDDI